MHNVRFYELYLHTYIYIFFTGSTKMNNACSKSVTLPNNWVTSSLESKKFSPMAPSPSWNPKENPSQQKIPSSTSRLAVDNRERAFMCNYKNCGKTYLKSSHLKAHIRVHTGTLSCTHTNT